MAALSFRRPLLVVAHPDDETLSAFIAMRRAENTPVVVHVTDGAPRREIYWPEGIRSRTSYADARRREAERALSVLRIGADATVCLNAMDQESVFEIGRLVPALVDVIARAEPTVIVTHAYEGGHADHDATAIVAHAALALLPPTVRIPALVEMASYHSGAGTDLKIGSFLSPNDSIATSSIAASWTSAELADSFASDAQPTEIRLTAAELAEKRRMLAEYVTQADLQTMAGEREQYRIAPAYHFCRSPHSGRLLYEERDLGPPGDDFRQAAAEALRSLALDPASAL